MAKYRLIKELPFENGPKIGYISKPTHPKEPLHYWNHNWFNPKDYPEYWEEVIEPIFTTADGFDIFEGDKFYCVSFPNYFDIGIRTCGDGLAVKEESVRKRCFFKEKNAEEYVVMNKPCLSINDLLEDGFLMKESLIELVKSKLWKK